MFIFLFVFKAVAVKNIVVNGTPGATVLVGAKEPVFPKLL